MVTPRDKDLDDQDRTQAYAEAAAWLARLQSDDRTPQTEAAFQAWLSSSPAHIQAFERATDIWEMLPGAQTAGLQPANDDRRPKPARKSPVMAVSMAASLALATVLGGYVFAARPVTYETVPGQQEVITLRDGSRVSLNTDSRISVKRFGATRQVSLERGEVLFDVAHDPKHPFLVRAGDEQVKALGTSFVVRREVESLAVTLLNGKVELSRRAAAGSGSDYVPQTILAPGERATIDNQAHVVLDKPAVAGVTAWRHGQVIFSNITLLEAANELNRYGPLKIVLNDPRVARLRVSGVFETNDALEFANVMAQMNGLKVKRTGQTVELVN